MHETLTEWSLASNAETHTEQKVNNLNLGFMCDCTMLGCAKCNDISENVFGAAIANSCV